MFDCHMVGHSVLANSATVRRAAARWAGQLGFDQDNHWDNGQLFDSLELDPPNYLCLMHCISNFRISPRTPGFVFRQPGHAVTLSRHFVIADAEGRESIAGGFHPLLHRHGFIPLCTPCPCTFDPPLDGNTLCLIYFANENHTGVRQMTADVA